MGQLNIHMTPKFESMLGELMRVRGIATKSEAVRVAVEETLAAATRAKAPVDFTQWIGLANKAQENPDRRFFSDDDLWEKT